MVNDKLAPASSNAFASVGKVSDQTSLVQPGVTNASQFTTAIRTGTTPKIGISKEGSMLLAISRTPAPESVAQKHNSSSNGNDGLKRQTVLEEEGYLERMEEIIERDFFPGIQEMQKRIDAIDYLLEHGEQPVFSGSDDSNESKQSSLSEFLSKNTTEDNHSFAELMERDKTKMRERYPWLWTDSDSGKSANYGGVKNAAITAGTNTTGTQQRALDLVARMTPQIDHENRLRALQLGWTDERATTIQSWKTNSTDGPCNNLMFFKNKHGGGITAKQLENQATKIIQHSQTRFGSTETIKKRDDTGMSKEEILDSILGVNISNNNNKNHSSSSSSINNIKDNFSGPPKVNGYGFVTGVAGRQPRALPPSRSDEEGGGAARSFSIAEPSKRESLHARLLNRKLQTRKQEKTNPFGGAAATSASVLGMTSRITKTSSVRSSSSSASGRLTSGTKSNRSVMLSPAGSHLLSALSGGKSRQSNNTFKPALTTTTITPNRHLSKKK